MLSALLLLMECEIEMREQRSIREDGISFLVKTSNRFLKSGKKSWVWILVSLSLLFPGSDGVTSHL